MKYTKEEILKALNVIQDICIESQYCEECPLFENVDCGITHKSPSDWRIQNDEPPWRAFEV